jgi:hypothetical protein
LQQAADVFVNDAPGDLVEREYVAEREDHGTSVGVRSRSWILSVLLAKFPGYGACQAFRTGKSNSSTQAKDYDVVLALVIL